MSRKGRGLIYVALSAFSCLDSENDEKPHSLFPAEIRNGHFHNESARYYRLFGYIGNRKCKFVSGPYQREGHSCWYKWGQLPKVNKVCGDHAVAGQSIAQSRSRKTGNSHGLRIKLWNSCAEPVCIIGESSPLEFCRDVQILQLSLHCKRYPKQISKKSKKETTEDLCHKRIWNVKYVIFEPGKKHLFPEISVALPLSRNSEHAHARLFSRLSLIWTVLLPSDTRRKPITSITTVFLPFVTNLLTLPRIFNHKFYWTRMKYYTHASISPVQWQVSLLVIINDFW
jgi:hypothetical protein